MLERAWLKPILRTPTRDQAIVKIELIEDPEWEVRANAVQPLGMFGDVTARGGIPPLLDDPNAQVRQAAERALSRLK